MRILGLIFEPKPAICKSATANRHQEWRIILSILTAKVLERI